MSASSLVCLWWVWWIVVVFVTIMSSSTDAFSTTTTKKKVVSIVTGANGYVGREVVHALLDDCQWSNDGDDHDTMEILCLVRPSRVNEETVYWERFVQSSTSSSMSNCIKVLPYDMLDGGKTISEALELAFKDCDNEICVYHIASVFGPSEDHVKTARNNVQGTKDLVHAMGKFPSRKCRLVLTSSMAAVRGSGQEPHNGKYYTYQDWNNLSKLEDNNWGSSYQWSKAESERAAWSLAKELSIPMTSICPSFVFGPPSPGAASEGGKLNLSNSFSITLVGQWVRGESPVQSRLCVDVRDVARAHVAAGSRDTAIGERFIVSTEARVPSEEMAEELKKVSIETGQGDPGAISFDTNFQGGAIPIGSKEVEAVDRLQTLLGISPRPVHET
jgi:nucleoside-diphosphate-sugar epimerase